MSETAVSIENCAETCMDTKSNFVKKRMVEEIPKYSYRDFREHLNILCEISFRIIYFSYGFVQFLATWSVLTKVFHSENIIVLLTSLGLGFLPVVGTFSGICCAHLAWGWDLSGSILIFFVIPYFIVNGPMLMIAVFETYKDWMRWQSEKAV